MAPCQYCYCANKNKLLCNTGGASTSALQLGSYKLSVCETNLQQDINALYPKPLRDGPVESEVTRGTEAVEDKADDVADDDFPGIDAKSIDVEGYKADEQDDENETENTETIDTTVIQPSTKGSVKKTVKKQIIRKEKHVGATFTTTLTPEQPSGDEENSASNDKVDGGLNIDLDQPAADSHQNKEEQLEKTELRHQPASTDSNEKTKSSSIFIHTGTLTDMLDKFIHLAIRKSMMTLQPGGSCVPGSETRVQCNSCFCLKNGKMLCTNKNC